MTIDLEPIDPDEAVALYLTDRENELAQTTLRSYESRLKYFLKWCLEEEDIENLNELTGRDMHRYRVWRRNDGDLSPSSEKSQQDCIRTFIKFLEKIDAVRPDLSTSVVSPTLSDDEAARDELVDEETAEAILDYLDTFEYASARHVTFRLAWRTALRRGSVRALDLQDYDAELQALEVVHRPPETPLKNKKRGERYIALSDETCAILDAWIENRRPDVTGRDGREPLLVTSNGRPHPGTLQTWVYSATRPCLRTGECPHDRDIEECRAATDQTEASRCPSSMSPHTLRRGAVTYWLSREQPKHWVSSRADMSSQIIDRHYDGRDSKEQMEQRRGYLDNI